jgi:hypothetical protein
MSAPSARVLAIAAKHDVSRTEDLDIFLVRSAGSGKTYTVTLGISGVIGSARCGCDWAVHRGSACSHVIALQDYYAPKHPELFPFTPPAPTWAGPEEF